MTRPKKLTDLIVPLAECPRIPAWGALKEAVVLLNLAYRTGNRAVLVFDKTSQLVGLLKHRDVLRALGAGFEKHFGQGPVEWADLKPGDPDRLSRPVSDFMTEIEVWLDEDDTPLSAAHLMMDSETQILPVLGHPGVLGLVRFEDLFHEISNAVLDL